MDFYPRSDIRTQMNSQVEIDHPVYYGQDSVYETIKVIEAWLGSVPTQYFCLGNVLKYISRADKKETSDGLTDLKKALWYLNKVIEMRERDDASESSTAYV